MFKSTLKRLTDYSGFKFYYSHPFHCWRGISKGYVVFRSDLMGIGLLYVTREGFMVSNEQRTYTSCIFLVTLIPGKIYSQKEIAWN